MRDAPGAGGFAGHIVARTDYCMPLPNDTDPVAVAPLLCAGLIGWRCLLKTGWAKRIGPYGFGAEAHIITQVACRRWRRDVPRTPGQVTRIRNHRRRPGCLSRHLSSLDVNSPVGWQLPALDVDQSESVPLRLGQHRGVCFTMKRFQLVVAH
jgi:hypothetical protein